MAGASGGAYAPRQGAAAGRFGAWWAAACITGLVDDWPVAGDELAEACDEVQWYAWSDLFPTTGWGFHVAAADPLDGLAWAISATDAHLMGGLVALDFGPSDDFVAALATVWTRVTPRSRSTNVCRPRLGQGCSKR